MKNYLKEIIDLTASDNYLCPPITAKYDNGTHQRSESTITSISIHHDASVRPHDYDSVARYHSEAQEHYNRLGPGLQYHYKIDNTGQIFKIRPHATWLYTVGSAENVTSLSICLDGYFHSPYNQIPTREQYEALGQLLVRLCEESPQLPATYPDVRPHRDYSSTACCGDTLAPYVFAIQDKVTATTVPANAVYDWPEYQSSTPPPAPTPTPVPVPVPQPPAIPAPVPVPLPPAPTVPAIPSHDYGEENNTLLKKILSILQELYNKIVSIFK